MRTAYAMAEAFRAAGLAAEALDGSTPAVARQATLARLRTGATQVLANCALLTEGFDEPSIAAIVMARPTMSKPLYIQMLGRGTRLYPGKTDCLILDVVGASTRHALLTTAALFDVDPATLAQRALTAAVAARVPTTPAPCRRSRPRARSWRRPWTSLRSRPLHWVQTQFGAWVLSSARARCACCRLRTAPGPWSMRSAARHAGRSAVACCSTTPWAWPKTTPATSRPVSWWTLARRGGSSHPPRSSWRCCASGAWHCRQTHAGAAADLLTAVMGDWD